MTWTIWVQPGAVQWWHGPSGSNQGMPSGDMDLLGSTRGCLGFNQGLSRVQPGVVQGSTRGCPGFNQVLSRASGFNQGLSSDMDHLGSTRGCPGFNQGLSSGDMEHLGSTRGCQVTWTIWVQPGVAQGSTRGCHGRPKYNVVHYWLRLTI